MAAALSAVIFGPDGRLAMVVHPDDARELDDPAFNPPGHVHVRMARAAYDALPQAINVDGLAQDQDLAKALVGVVAKVNPDVAAKMQQRIASADAALAAVAVNDAVPL